MKVSFPNILWINPRSTIPSGIQFEGSPEAVAESLKRSAVLYDEIVVGIER